MRAEHMASCKVCFTAGVLILPPTLSSGFPSVRFFSLPIIPHSPVITGNEGSELHFRQLSKVAFHFTRGKIRKKDDYQLTLGALCMETRGFIFLRQ
jgi:hypothetical protein